MIHKDQPRVRRSVRSLAWAGVLALVLLTPAAAQVQQRVDVVIKDFTFITHQVPLQLHVPILITIRNDDMVRHDFGTPVFQGTMTQVESDGVISYGREIGGVYVDPKHAAAIRFTLSNPGRYQFKCSIHPAMKGELLMMNVGAV